MNPTIVCMIVFTCTFGGALLGMWLRTTLPEHHLDAESKDTVKVGIGLIATMTALVLGLITASAKSSFDDMEAAVKTITRLLKKSGLHVNAGFTLVAFSPSADLMHDELVGPQADAVAPTVQFGLRAAKP